jgi:iron complex transport system substrate-binding protein
MIRALLAFCLLLLPGVAQARERIVALGGDVTEIVFALGAGDQLVGVDATSQWPAEADRLPEVGYLRTLAAEGTLALRPTLILASAKAGPAPVMQQLGQLSRVVSVPEDETLAGVEAKITLIARTLKRDRQGAALIAQFRQEVARLGSSTAPGVKVLPLLSAGGGRLMACGRGSAADAMLRLAGAVNVAAGLEGCKPYGPEAAAAAAPEVILLPSHALDQIGGIEKARALPQVALTPAGRSGRIVVFDSLRLLSFGLRTPSAARDLRLALAGGATR